MVARDSWFFQDRALLVVVKVHANSFYISYFDLDTSLYFDQVLGSYYRGFFFFFFLVSNLIKFR